MEDAPYRHFELLGHGQLEVEGTLQRLEQDRHARYALSKDILQVGPRVLSKQGDQQSCHFPRCWEERLVFLIVRLEHTAEPCVSARYVIELSSLHPKISQTPWV